MLDGRLISPIPGLAGRLLGIGRVGVGYWSLMLFLA